MKKLIMAALMIGFAVTTAQAAHFKWAFTAGKSTVPADSKFDGATVYLVLASDLQTYLDSHDGKIASAADLTGLAKSQGTLNAGSMSTTTGGIEVKSPTDFSFEEGSISYYNFVIDGDKYFQSDLTTAVAVADKTTPTLKTFASGTKLGDAGNFTSFSGGGDVPEPTSGLLLLLGVAGLALRRKQA